MTTHEQSTRDLTQMDHEELVQHAIYFQTLSKKYCKELKKKETKIEKQHEKICELKNKKNKSLGTMPESFNIPNFVGIITNLSLKIRDAFPYGGKEHHFQAALEMELREHGIVVAQEVACLLHYKTTNNAVRQLPHDVRGREDLLLPDMKYIIELKQIKALTEDDHRQLLRYMDERYRYDAEWGLNTKGLLINFGDIDVEIWYMFYPSNKVLSEKYQARPQRIKIAHVPINDLHTSSDAWLSN
tara:strand:+ start:1727 stop:2455 length:729 start_codon:yes stop_codon:yes gene_type:complete